jgi:hypothetical protein
VFVDSNNHFIEFDRLLIPTVLYGAPFREKARCDEEGSRAAVKSAPLTGRYRFTLKGASRWRVGSPLNPTAIQFREVRQTLRIPY